jgi:2-(1,2-epoxy-1,2-dihydrophenyl)acetyl-CoA isomerase
MVTQSILVTRDDTVGILTIHRPQRFNSLDVATARDLRKSALQLARDPAVRCLVLRGVAGVFCSGADLKSIVAGDDHEELSYLHPAGVAERIGYSERFKEILEYLHSTISELKRAPKPVIAAVDGIAAAGGFGLAMACDLVFASERATFEWAYHKTGLTGAESSTFFLPRLVGLRTAMDLMLLNPRIDAHRAAELHLVSAVLPCETFEADVIACAQRLADGPTQAYAVAKGLINRAAGVEQLDYHLDEELQHLTRAAGGVDVAEGLAAFIQKRGASFRGSG